MEAEIGSIQVGKKADIVIVNENLIANFKVLTSNGPPWGHPPARSASKLRPCSERSRIAVSAPDALRRSCRRVPPRPPR
jgi:hypothetical protein